MQRTAAAVVGVALAVLVLPLERVVPVGFTVLLAVAGLQPLLFRIRVAAVGKVSSS